MAEAGKEKGVDVHLAVDIVKDVILKECCDILIMSGDADLIYPLEMAYCVNSALVLNYKNKFETRGKKLPRQLKIITIKKPRI